MFNVVLPLFSCIALTSAPLDNNISKHWSCQNPTLSETTICRAVSPLESLTSKSTPALARRSIALEYHHDQPRETLCRTMWRSLNEGNFTDVHRFRYFSRSQSLGY